MERKPEAQATAFKRCVAKLKRIKELGITPDTPIEEQDKLVEDLSLAKAVEQQGDVKDFRSGQRYYVESLVEFSGMSPQDQLDHEYAQTFADQANETEMVEALRELAAA